MIWHRLAFCFVGTLVGLLVCLTLPKGNKRTLPSLTTTTSKVIITATHLWRLPAFALLRGEQTTTLYKSATQTKQSEPLLRRFASEKNNAFFDRQAFVRECVVEDKRLPSTLSGYLREWRQLTGVDLSGELRESRPRVIVERMAAIDLLELVARQEDFGLASQAIKALNDIVQQPLDSEMPERLLRPVMAEKFDSLSALARLDPDEAVRSFKDVDSQAMRRILLPAIKFGLIDAGRSKADAATFIEQRQLGTF